uniref:Zinc finger, CCHC-type n=1 Tax=Tanacetum cinerariifolium TaxID=118510 RepID=A0A6L2J1C1_TANCI|nr:hypothetical protein [Tanacetum cinerariifolium]
MFVIEQPLLAAPAVDSEAQFENSSPYDMIRELISMFKKQIGVERFDLIQTFHACKQKEGKPVGAYVLKMKDYMEQLKRLGYVFSQDISVGLILNGLTSDFAATPQVMVIQDGRIQKANKKSLNAKGKEHPTKDDTFHHCKKVGHWKRNYHVSLLELIKKKKQVGTTSSSGNGVHAQVKAIGSYDLILPNGLVICLDNCNYAPTITRGVV